MFSKIILWVVYRIDSTSPSLLMIHGVLIGLKFMGMIPFLVNDKRMNDSSLVNCNAVSVPTEMTQ